MLPPPCPARPARPGRGRARGGGSPGVAGAGQGPAGAAGVVVIGGEGALVLGGLAAVSAALSLPKAPPGAAAVVMALAAFAVGGLWVALAGALRALRGVNET